MTLAWVIGAGGLLGGALCRQLRQQGTDLWQPLERISWQSPDLPRQIQAATQSFALAAARHSAWEIYWAAGVGTMSSQAPLLAPETNALRAFLSALCSASSIGHRNGRIGLSSSAGAIYAGSRDAVINENTQAAPLSDYGKVKLAQEKMLADCLLCKLLAKVLISRFSTIYGPGQASAKRQGLLTHIARCTMRNEKIQVYVPLDTVRDYIYADDAASCMIEALRASDDRKVVTRIIASERPTTIAEICATFRRIARRRPLIVTSSNSLSSLYSRAIQFESLELPKLASGGSTSLAVGAARLLQAELRSYSCPQ